MNKTINRQGYKSTKLNNSTNNNILTIYINKSYSNRCLTQGYYISSINDNIYN